MSTLVTGDSGQIFQALQAGFDEAAKGRQVAMVLTVSNACPVTAR